MPRFLAIDWSPQALHVLAVRTAKGKATVEQSLAFALPQELTPATASTLGRAFKDALAQANIAAAPALVSVGRDRVIFKELTIPYVPAHEEPALVRFQAAKEMSEAASDVVLDYAPFAPAKAGQPTRVQVASVRKSIVTALTGLCQSAGLKIAGVIPRPLALAGLLDRKSPATMSLARGILIASGGEAEFCVYVADRLEWARTLSLGPTLAGDVQRNLMLLAAQKGVPELAKIETAGVSDLGDLGVPTQPLDPWREADARPQDATPFLPAVGLAEIAARPGGLPINFAEPKQPRPVAVGNERLKKMGMYAAAALVPLFLFGCYWTLSQTRAAIVALEQTKEQMTDDWKKSEQDRINVAALKEWDETTISWLDEIYDISARMPHAQGFRVTQFAAAPKPRRSGVKDSFTGTVTIHGNMASDQDALVTQFHEAMQGDKYLKPHSPTTKVNEFVIKIDVAPRPPVKFETPLVVPPQPKKAPEPPPEAAASEKTDKSVGKTADKKAEEGKSRE